MRLSLPLVTLLLAGCVCLPQESGLRTVCARSADCLEGLVCCSGQCVSRCEGPDAGASDAGACKGCVALELCVAGNTDDTCGENGAVCATCASGTQCLAGVCAPVGGAGGSAGIGGSSGAGGAAAVDAGSGETCDSPQQVNLSAMMTLTGIARPATASLSCGDINNRLPKRFFVFSLTQRSEVVFRPLGFSGALMLHSERCGAFQGELECEETPVSVRRVLAAGTYYLTVEAPAGMVNVAVTVTPLENGADCGNSLLMGPMGTGFQASGNLIRPSSGNPSGCPSTDDGGIVYLRFPTVLGDEYRINSAALVYGANSNEACAGFSTCRNMSDFVASSSTMRLAVIGVVGQNYSVQVTRTQRPPGDTCAAPIPVAGNSVSLDLGGYRLDQTSQCVPDAGPVDAVVRIDVSEPSRVQVTPAASTAVSLRGQCTGSDFCSGQYNSNRPVLAVLWGAGVVGLSNISVTPLPSETCATAGQLTVGQTATGDFGEAFDDNIVSLCGLGAGPDLVYRFVAPPRFTVRMTSDGGGQMVLQKNGCATSYIRSTCAALDGGVALLNEPSSDGGTYYIWVEGARAASYSLRVDPY